MKKSLLIILAISLICASFFLYLNRNQPHQSAYTVSPKDVGGTATSTFSKKEGPFVYTNTKLTISFSTEIPLYDRTSGGYVTVSGVNDPHFYQDKHCADNYTANCLAFEIQKVDLPGQSKEFVVSGLKNKTPMQNLNGEFDFYKEEDPQSPGWNISYFAIGKNSNLHYSILTNATSTVFIEKEIIPSFRSI